LQKEKKGLLLRVAAHSNSKEIRNSKETKAENNRLETKQYPAIQRNLTKNTIDYGTRSKTQIKEVNKHLYIITQSLYYVNNF
jgi:hypothetical protein